MKIRINNYIWTVEYVDHIFNSFGRTTFSKLFIEISKGQNEKLLKDTIFHETLHAYIKSYGFNKDYFNEEELVTFITQNINNIIELSNKIWKGLINEKEN